MLLFFNLANGTLHIFFFSLSYGNANQTLFSALNSLKKLAIPYFAYFFLWRHLGYIDSF